MDSSGRIDIAMIASLALDRIETVLHHWAPGGRRDGGEWVMGDRHGSPGQSFKIHLGGEKAGLWSDFATGDKGGDLVSYVAYIEGCGNLDAARKIADFLGITDRSPPVSGAVASRGNAIKPTAKSDSEWEPFFPVPDEAPAAPVALGSLGRPDCVYHYRGADGRLNGYVYRWDAKGKRGKEIRPLSYARGRDGRCEWRWMQLSKPRPLYGLELLASKPAAVVVLVEGEKAANAVRLLLPDHVGLTWSGGGNAVELSDYGPLAGRKVWLWPDADEPGDKAMQKARKLLFAAGVESVNFICLSALADARANGGLFKGFDAADLLSEGWDPARMAEFFARQDALIETRGRGRPKQDKPAGTSNGERMPSRFTLRDDGVYRPDNYGNPERLCGWVSARGIALDEGDDNCSVVVEFRDFRGRKRERLIPRAMLAGDGYDGIKRLIHGGLDVRTEKKQDLDQVKAYLWGSVPFRDLRIIRRPGWYGLPDGVFVYPDGSEIRPREVAPGEADGFVFDDIGTSENNRRSALFAARGALDDWKENVAALALNNPLLMFSISAALTGPLLPFLGSERYKNPIFHLVGASSKGKTTAAMVAASVWGDAGTGRIKSWHTTMTAMEADLEAANHGLYIVDEIGQAPPKDLGKVVYMVWAGEGKGRATVDAKKKSSLGWLAVVLSTGEHGLEHLLSRDGGAAEAGQEVRFIELSADGWEHGAFSDLHGAVDGRAFSDLLKESVRTQHGTAAREFIKRLADRPEEVRGVLEKVRGLLQANHRIANNADRVSGQVWRVLDGFVAVAVAGELAARWGVCPWAELDAVDSVSEIFNRWLDARPTLGDSEDYKIASYFASLVTDRQDKFEVIDRKAEDGTRSPKVIDPYGFIYDASGDAEDYAAASNGELRHESEGGFKEVKVYTEPRIAMSPQRFKSLCKEQGFSSRRAAKVLSDPFIDFLELESDGDRKRKTKTIPAKYQGVGFFPKFGLSSKERAYIFNIKKVQRWQGLQRDD